MSSKKNKLSSFVFFFPLAMSSSIYYWQYLKPESSIVFGAVIPFFAQRILKWQFRFATVLVLLFLFSHLPLELSLSLARIDMNRMATVVGSLLSAVVCTLSLLVAHQ